MKINLRVRATFLAFCLLTGTVASAAPTNSPVLRNVVCEKNSSGQVRDCSVLEMKQMIRSLKAAKAQGEEQKLTLGQQANKVGKGLLIVGGTWFATSVLIAVIDAEFSMAATYALSGALGTLLHFNIPGGWEIPRRFVEGYMFRGLIIGGAATLAGGVITLLTPSSASDGTLTSYYAQDENFGKLIDLPEDQILALAEKDAKLGNKIVSVYSIALKSNSQ